MFAKVHLLISKSIGFIPRTNTKKKRNYALRGTEARYGEDLLSSSAAIFGKLD